MELVHNCGVFYYLFHGSSKSLYNLSSLCKIQLFAINNKENSSNQKLRKNWAAKTVMSSYILCKIWGFSKENFSESIRYIGLKFSEITEIVMLFQ